MNNREKFLSLVIDNKLDREDVAELLRVTRHQIDNWMVSAESAHHEEIPDMAIELLELKLKLRQEQQSG